MSANYGNTDPLSGFSKPSDFPDLLSHQAEVQKYLNEGAYPEQIYGRLFLGNKSGIQPGRFMLFCYALKTSQKQSEPTTMPQFPELDPFKDWLGMALFRGITADELFDGRTAKAPVFNERTGQFVEVDSPLAVVSTTRERVRAYCDAIVAAVTYSPTGGVNPALMEVPEQQFTWERKRQIFSIGNETWSLDQMTQGTLIFGATGSGKTTASGRTIAQAFLRQEFGGLVLTTKKGEAEDWVKLCMLCGRGQEFSWIRYNSPLKINILDYETSRPGVGAQLTENLVGFFRTLLTVMGNRHGQRVNEDFWEKAGNQLLRNLFNLFLLSKSKLSLDTLAEFVVNAPLEEFTGNNSEKWRTVPVFGDYMDLAEKAIRSYADDRVFQNLKSYWLREYPRLNPNTRSCITFSFSAMIDVLRSRHIYELLCTDTFFITPEQMFSGRIFILDLPVKEFGDAGVLVQSAYKYLFQKAVERRPDQGDNTRPVFLWEDEGQHFFSEYDPVFQQTARSSRVARVLLSQNVNNFYAHLGGGDQARNLFNSLAGNLNTRIFHANGDMQTNQWASEMFGSAEKTFSSTSTSKQSETFNPLRTSHSSGTSTTSRREPLVFPQEFAQLKTGGEENGYISEAFVYRVGPPFQSTGQPFLKANFQQYFI